MPEPVAPTDVAVSYANGERVPVPCVYVSRDAAGVAQWDAMLSTELALALVERRATLTIGVLPGLTAVRVAFAGGND